MGRVRQNYQNIKALSNFGCILAVMEIFVFLLFAIFVRLEAPLSQDPLEHERVYGLVSVNLLAVVGFGLFMGFVQNYHLSPLTFVLLILVMSWQFYILMHSFWAKALNGFASDTVAIYINLKMLIRASRCGLSAMIGMSAAMGRFNPKDILKMLPIFIFGYALSQTVIELKLEAFDFGGTAVIFAYGASFALVVSFIMAKKVLPASVPMENYRSIVLALIGTLFMWVCWPVFNYTLYAETDFQRRLIITNTLLALGGSCLAVVVLTAAYKEGLSVMMLQKATLSGGVAIGISVQVIYLPVLAIVVGILAGVLSFLSLRHLQGRFEIAWGLLDTCGILSVGLFPSVLGAIASCVILSAYYYQGLNDAIPGLSNPQGVFGSSGYTYNQRGGLQIGALFLSIGVSIFSAAISGFLVAVGYKEDPDSFYLDDEYIDVDLDVFQEQKTQYNAEAGTRFNAPESSARFQTQYQEASTNKPRKRGRVQFKTRYAT